MAVTLATTPRNAACDAVVDLADAGGGTNAHLRIYDGTRPSSANDAVSTQTLLVELDLNNPAFGSASSGVATLQATPISENALASGTATWFRIVDTDGDAVLDGDVDTSSAELIVNTTATTSGVSFEVTAGTITMPSGE